MKEPFSEEWEKHKTKFAEYKRQFLSKEITEDVLRASLYGLGFRGQGLKSEVNLIKMEEEDATKRPASSAGTR